MWIFLSDSFVSIVAPQPGGAVDPEKFLIVRARVRGDIERLFPRASVNDSGGTDYRFRAVIDRNTVTARIARAVGDIDYTNFKDTVPTKARHDAYFSVWSTMADLQDRFVRAPWRRRG